MEKAFIEEKEKLDKVINYLNKKIKETKNKFESQQNFRIGFSEGKKGTQFVRQSLMSLYATEEYNLKKVIDNPYFGRMDFKEYGKDKIDNIYIGKKTILGDDNDIITYDWRSNIASMYYDYSLGKSKYNDNIKDINGEILNKRQINIKNSELVSVDEQDTLNDDEILLKYLSENSDSRLKSIIATIQKEQNAIIRNKLKDNYIVQGTAGSGKTTVALHRIAYLLYNNAKEINDDDFMILAPNKYFLNYISTMLPELDINNVSQNTFEQIALDNIGKVKIESLNKSLENILENDNNKDIISYKTSLEYLNLIKEFITFYINSHINKPITYNGIELYSLDKLKSDISFDNFDVTNYTKKINALKKRISNNIKENSVDLSHEIWLKYRDEYLSLDENDPRREEILRITEEAKKDLSKGCIKQLKEYFKFIEVSPLNLYIAFVESLNNNIISNVDCDKLKENTLNKLSKKVVGNEDLAPILYIKYLMKGIEEYKDFGHIIIDEGQDLSVSDYYVLKLLFNKANFDIYGDMNQSIYSYKSIKNWDKLNDLVFDSKCKLLRINKGYRTTKQISDTSNYILNSLNYNETETIARTGNDIVFNKNNKNDELLFEEISNYINDGYNTIAIICKDEKETDKVYKYLTKQGLEVNKISESNLTYNGGITVLPPYLSKGLEFDVVILYDADEKKYNCQSEIDMKLLYVAVTRAMHELCINYSNELTEPLYNLLKERKEKKLIKNNF